MSFKKPEKAKGLAVNVPDGQFEKSLRIFKKKVQDAGLLRELKEREQYVKPSIQRKLDRNSAKKRWQKYLDSTKLPEKKY